MTAAWRNLCLQITVHVAPQVTRVHRPGTPTNPPFRGRTGQWRPVVPRARFASTVRGKCSLTGSAAAVLVPRGNPPPNTMPGIPGEQSCRQRRRAISTRQFCPHLVHCHRHQLRHMGAVWLIAAHSRCRDHESPWMSPLVNDGRHASAHGCASQVRRATVTQRIGSLRLAMHDTRSFGSNGIRGQRAMIVCVRMCRQSRRVMASLPLGILSMTPIAGRR